MSDSFPIFDASGRMLGNQTGNQGQLPVLPSFNWSIPALPALPSAFAPSQTSQGARVVSIGGTSTGGNIPATDPNSVGVPSNAQATNSPVLTSGGIADYFLRAVIVILGFIFVAVGLRMFGVPVPQVPGIHK